MLVPQNLISLFFLFFLLVAKGQNKPYTIPDSIKAKSYDWIMGEINNSENDSTKIIAYIDFFLDKAKREKDTSQIMRGYRKKMDVFSLKIQENYADSILHIAISAKNREDIGKAYIYKAEVYYAEKEYQNALNSYLQADKYISEKNNPYVKYKIRFGIGNVHFYLGHYNQSLNLFILCRDYYKQQEGYNNLQGYLYSLRMVSRCYFELGKYEQTAAADRTGLDKSQAPELSLIHAYFMQTEGLNQYKLHNYKASIAYLNESLQRIQQNNDFANEALNYLYLAKAYIALDNYNEALPYLNKVDNLFREKQYTNPELRETYVILIQYYKQKGNLEKQLEYTNQLLAVNEVLKKNYDYLVDKIHTGYDTRNLKAEKLRLENEMAKDRRINAILYILAILVIITIGGFALASYKKQRTYRKKYEELVNRPVHETPKPEVTEESTSGLEINHSIIIDILKKLEKFEEEKGFLNNSLNQSLLAEMLGTNTSYLSKIINHYKGKNFNAYINELRINYGIDLLKQKRKYRNYSIKALSEELGFSNPRSFSDTFFTQTGIKPSYFIKKLHKELQEA